MTQFAIPKASFSASSFSTSLELLSTNLTVGDTTKGATQIRLEISLSVAGALSMVTKGSAGTTIASGMLLPKTNSAALTINTWYTFHHEARGDRQYNYTLSNTSLVTGGISELAFGEFYV